MAESGIIPFLLESRLSAKAPLTSAQSKINRYIYTPCTFQEVSSSKLNTNYIQTWKLLHQPNSFKIFFKTCIKKKLLQYTPLYNPEVSAISPCSENIDISSSSSSFRFERNIVLILSVLLCAVIFSLGMFSMIKSAIKCPGLVSADSGPNPLARLASKGEKRKTLKTFPIVKYSDECKLPAGLDKECVICLSEFAPGEHVRILPKCNHGFHVLCINKWLSSHSSCPTCRYSLIETSQKAVGWSQASSSVVPSSGSGEHCV